MCPGPVRPPRTRSPVPLRPFHGGANGVLQSKKKFHTRTDYITKKVVYFTFENNYDHSMPNGANHPRQHDA